MDLETSKVLENANADIVFMEECSVVLPSPIPPSSEGLPSSPGAMTSNTASEAEPHQVSERRGCATRCDDPASQSMPYPMPPLGGPQTLFYAASVNGAGKAKTNLPLPLDDYRHNGSNTSDDSGTLEDGEAIDNPLFHVTTSPFANGKRVCCKHSPGAPIDASSVCCSASSSTGDETTTSSESGE
jgi:hypothetical protein